MNILSLKTHWNRLPPRTRLFLLTLVTCTVGVFATLCVLRNSLKEVLYKAF